MDQLADTLMNKLADKLFDVGLIDDDEADQLNDEDELASVLGLRGGAAMKAMKAMKAMAAMKAMKAMKKKAMKKKAMKKLKAFTEKRHAFTGKLSKTRSGLTKSDLVKNNYGKVVSKKMSLRAKKN